MERLKPVWKHEILQKIETTHTISPGERLIKDQVMCRISYWDALDVAESARRWTSRAVAAAGVRTARRRQPDLDYQQARQPMGKWKKKKNQWSQVRAGEETEHRKPVQNRVKRRVQRHATVCSGGRSFNDEQVSLASSCQVVVDDIWTFDSILNSVEPIACCSAAGGGAASRMHLGSIRDSVLPVQAHRAFHPHFIVFFCFLCVEEKSIAWMRADCLPNMLLVFNSSILTDPECIPSQESYS